MRKAPCKNADQSSLQEAPTDTTRGAGAHIIPALLQKYKEEF